MLNRLHLRIISGIAKGLQLRTPPGNGQLIRPTSDRNREALFSIIHNQVPESLVLDLFAGTGALGIEAMSRGARAVTFIDRSPIAIKLIKKNITSFLKSYQNSIDFYEDALKGVEENVPPFKVIQRDLRKGLHFLLNKQENESFRFDLIFIDPPYLKGLTRQALDQIDKGGFLSPDGLLIAEEHSKEKLPEMFHSLRLTDRRQYSDTTFWLYKKI